MIRAAAALSFFAVLASSGAASAEEIPTKPEQKSFLDERREETTTAPWFISVGVAAISIVALVLVKKKAKLAGGEEPIRLVSTRSVGPKVRLVLVETRGRELLLSVGDKNAELISEWPVDDTADLAPAAEEEPEAPNRRGIDPRDIQLPIEPAFDPKPIASNSAAVAGLLRMKRNELRR